ncbi:MAG: molybdopterin-binding/glycosyltransferase family 2 protein [Alphaproteobacteria bacterium]
MKFGRVPLDEAAGTILVHSTKAGGRTLKKGSVLSADDVAALRSAGIAEVTAARLEAGDIGEDAAARRIAEAAAGPGLAPGTAFTGRCNLFAEARGLVVFERERLDRCNLVDEAVTIATLTPYDLVEPRDLVATVKIIPLAVAEDTVAACAAIAAGPQPLLRIARLEPKSAGLIQTRLPGTKERVLDKTLETMRARLAALGGTLAREVRCDHDADAVAAAIGEACAAGVDLVLVLGASATVDRRDVVPAAIDAAGGTVEHFGMPVDPGNLTLIARAGRVPILGLPGSARSPRIHGVDWVLRRICAGIPVGGRDLMLMGAGGLLKEIPQRPLPRAKASPPAQARPAPAARPRIAALVLAAGRSRRMGKANKLLSEIGGEPMVARVVRAAVDSRAEPVVVVTGHEAAKVRAALSGHDVAFADNPDYAQGLSTSLAAGLAALAADIDGAVVCLGDMPRIDAGLIDRLIEAFAPEDGRTICVPTHGGKRGNPVLWARRYFAEIEAIAGDVGARHLIGEHADAVCEVAVEDDAALIDIDTPAELAEAKRLR